MTHPLANAMIRSEIENLVTEIFQYGTGYDPEIHTAPMIDITTDQILALITKSNQELLDRVEREVVGEDLEWDVKQNYGYKQQYQNALRAEQRATIDRIRSDYE